MSGWSRESQSAFALRILADRRSTIARLVQPRTIDPQRQAQGDEEEARANGDDEDITTKLRHPARSANSS
jgi:hypothetical protein